MPLHVVRWEAIAMTINKMTVVVKMMGSRRGLYLIV